MIILCVCVYMCVLGVIKMRIEHIPKLMSSKYSQKVGHFFPLLMKTIVFRIFIQGEQNRDPEVEFQHSTN